MLVTPSELTIHDEGFALESKCTRVTASTATRANRYISDRVGTTTREKYRAKSNSNQAKDNFSKAKNWHKKCV